MAEFTRRQLLLGTGAVAAVGVAGLYYARNDRESAQQLRPISVRFPIPTIESGQATFYLAQDRGAYRRQGLDVTFELGAPETNPVRMVAAGTNLVGVVGGPDTMLVARGRGVPLKAIAVLHRNSNFSCLLSLKESGLTRVEQLRGRKVGFFYGHISTDVLRSLFKKEGVTVEEVDVGFNYGALISKQVDASWAFTVTAGLELPAKGTAVNIISPADYGIVSHGYTIFAMEESIRNRRDDIVRFLRASLEGVSATVSDPQAAVASMRRRSPQTDLDLLSRRQQAYNAVTSSGGAYPPGYMDAAMFAETYERLVAVGSIEKPFDVRTAYTTEFLEEIHGRSFG